MGNIRTLSACVWSEKLQLIGMYFVKKIQEKYWFLQNWSFMRDCSCPLLQLSIKKASTVYGFQSLYTSFEYNYEMEIILRSYCALKATNNLKNFSLREKRSRVAFLKKLLWLPKLQCYSWLWLNGEVLNCDIEVLDPNLKTGKKFVGSRLGQLLSPLGRKLKELCLKWR